MSQSFCKHLPHTVIDDIWEPLYHKDAILISTAKVPQTAEHILIKFKKCNQYKEWFYMSGRMVRKHPTQKNGNGMVYVVPMSKREEFTPIVKCEHDLK